MAQLARDMRHGGRFHLDDRGIRYCDIFPEIEKGDINVSYIEPGAAALWHRHQIQADYQIVVKGGLKIGVCNLPNTNYNQGGYQDEAVKLIDEYQQFFVDEWKEVRDKHQLYSWSETEPEVEWYYLNEKNANEGPLYIPTGLWHGCYNYTNEQAILIYHITEKYDGTDEERMDPNLALWDYERVNK